MAAIGGLAVVTQVMVAYAASLAKPGERGPVGLRLALQLPFLKISESMGNHDSKIVGACSVD